MLSTLEKELLLGALKRDRKKEPFCVVLGKQLDKDEGNSLLEFLCGANQPSEIPIPLSTEGVSQFLANAESAVINPILEPDTWSPAGIHQIDFSQRHLETAKPNVVQGLKKLALCSMFPKNCDLSSIEVHCDKLLLIQKGGYWKPHQSPIEKPGMFGIIILHIPVIGGHRGGCLKITNPGGKQSFNHGRASDDENFHLTTFLMDSEVELEPVTEGTCAMLFFHLIWKEATAAADSPLDFPVYSSAVSTAQSILSTWAGDSSRSNEKTTETIQLRNTQKQELSSTQCLILNDEPSKDRKCVLSNLDSSYKTKKSDLQDVTEEFLNGNRSSNVTHSAIDEGFISSTSEDNPQLPQENLQTVVNYSPDSPEPAISTNNSAEPTSHSNSEEDSSQEDEKESELNLLSRIKESQDNPAISPLLFFPLDGRYSSKKLYFSALRGRDRLVASVFRSIPAVDVDLAQVSMQVSSEKDCCAEELDEDCDCPFELKVRLTLFVGNDGQQAIRLPEDEGLLLNVQNQLLGKVKDFLFSSGRMFHHRTVLIIWPRAVSISFRCNYIFDHFLDELEESPTSSQTEPMKTLRQVISFCEQNPVKVWDPSLSAVRSRRLLALCIHLNAKQEGLTLLRLMDQQVGIGSKNAKVIAEFTTRVAGWRSCADAVLALITVRLRQWGYFISLVRHLKYLNCFEGVSAVAGKLVALLPLALQSSLEEELTELLLNKLIDLVIVLEMDEKTKSSERVNELIRLLPSIGISPLTSLAVHLSDSGWLRPSTSAESCRPFFRALLTEISSKEKDLYDSLVLREEASFAVKLLDSFHRWKNGSMTDKLLKTICSSHGPLLKQILDCRTILHLQKSSLFSMISSRLTTLAEDRATREPGDLVKLFRLGLKLLYENGPSWLTNSFLSFFTQLESEERFQLLADIWTLDGCRILAKKLRHPTVFDFFKELCSLSVSLATEPVQLPAQLENQLFECFFNHLDNIELTASLAEKTSGTWNETKIEIIHRALRQLGTDCNSSVFVKLMSAATTALCNHSFLTEVTPTPSIDNDAFLKLIQHQLFLTLAFQTVENHQSLVARFGQLFSSVTDGILSRLVLDVYRAHKMRSSSSLRESRPHWNVFRELCRIFSGRDLTKFITKSDDTLELMKGLFWLEDAQVVTAYACQLATAFPPPKENNLLWDVLGSVEVRSMTSYNTSARVAYLVLLDERMAQLSAALARLPVVSWEDPEARVPGHPEVEEFLRSPAQDKLFYPHPASPDFNTAAFFSLRLKKECDSRGFELYVKTLWIDGKVTCQLRKLSSAASSSSSPSPPEEMEEDVVLLNADQMRSELEHLTIARQKFAPRQKSQFFVPDNKCSAPVDSYVSNGDEMVELGSSPPQTKRIKIDCCQSEIESVGLPSIPD